MSPTWTDTVRRFWLASTRMVVGAAAVVVVDPEPGAVLDVVPPLAGAGPRVVLVDRDGADGPAVVELARDDVVVDLAAVPLLPPPPHADRASATGTSTTTARLPPARSPSSHRGR